MNELVKVTQNEKGEQLVSARELHSFLGVTERFQSWFDRMLQFEFEEGTDFTSVKSFTVVNNGAKRELQDYILKISMAKEISMLQRNEKGKQARKYFIECEKQLQNLQPKLPSTYKEALIELLAKVEENEKLQLENKTQKDYIDHVVINKKYYITPTVIGNKFGMSGAKINKILQELQVQYKQGKKWCLKKDYYGIGDYGYYQKPNGEWEKGSSLRFTNEGERIIYDMLIMHGYETTK